MTTDSVATLGAGVDGTVRELTTSYDDAGRVYELTSLDGSSNVLNQLRRTYNGLGQLAREYQAHGGAVIAVGNFSTPGTPYVYYTYGNSAQGSRLTEIVYPKSDGGPIMAGGDRTLTYFYDNGLDATISRLSSIGQEGDQMTLPPTPPTYFEVYDYLGLATVVGRRHPEADVDLVYYSDPTTGTTGDAGDQYIGLDRFGRIADQRWVDSSSSGVDLDRYQYGHDRNGNRLYEENLLDSSKSELYHDGGGYDKLDRLTSFARWRASLTLWLPMRVRG